MKEILLPVLWIGGIGGILGIVLAIASKVFAVKVDERIPKITEALQTIRKHDLRDVK